MEATVIIPTYNKAIYLELTLESLFHQSIGKSQYEVIVIDDGSSDNTESIVEHYRGREWNLQYIKQSHLGRSVARNTGILAAKGKIIIFVDDDCICNRNLIEAHLERHRVGTGKKAVLGLFGTIFTRIPVNQESLLYILKGSLYEISPVEAEKSIDKIQAILPDVFDFISAEDIAHNPEKLELAAIPPRTPRTLSLMSIREATFACPWFYYITRNASVDRNSVIEVGLFDENFRGWGEEDPELGYRLYHAGVEFDAALDAILYHQMHPRHKAKQAREWISNYMRFANKYKTPEIYLRWQVIQKAISMDQYQAIIRRIEAGLLSDEEKDSIEKSYHRFVIESLKDRYAY